jgi:tetratricopeptide (TPR) repeat protein
MSLKSYYQYALIITLCWLPLSASFASTCSNSESLKTFIERGDYRWALSELDNCLTTMENQSPEDLQLFDDLIKKILSTDKEVSFEEAYRNFQSALKIHRLNGLEFEFAHSFETNEEDKELFSDVRQADEKYYFYYDTGRFFSHSRGIALTDKAVIWKNLSSQPVRLAFDEIKSLKLVYNRGFSLTGWTLRFNDDENQVFRLSGIHDEAIIPFIEAIRYFINFNQTLPSQVTFIIPEKEIAILGGWLTQCSEKHVVLDHPIKEFQLLDACFSFYGKDFKLSQADKILLNQIITALFERNHISFAEGYNNFRVLLSSHFFSDFGFKFKNHIDAKIEANLFKDVHNPTEKYYFYFDMGTVSSGSRGLALTDSSILWKNLIGTSFSWRNLMGNASQLPFDKITEISLLHEIGLNAITGWKLRLNGNTDYEIAISGVSEDNVELFASALVYFINMASGANFTLQVPPETRDYLTKTFLERHPKIKSITDSVLNKIMLNSSE